MYWALAIGASSLCGLLAASIVRLSYPESGARVFVPTGLLVSVGVLLPLSREDRGIRVYPEQPLLSLFVDGAIYATAYLIVSLVSLAFVRGVSVARRRTPIYFSLLAAAILLIGLGSRSSLD